jgi:hypothetical protein
VEELLGQTQARDIHFNVTINLAEYYFLHFLLDHVDLLEKCTYLYQALQRRGDFFHAANV